MNFPKELKYSKSHEWVIIEGGTAKIGLTDYAQDALGSIVFVNLPEVGDSVDVEGDIGEVESVKSVSTVYAPLSGTISAVNEELLDTPEKINEDPYGTWMVEMSDIGGTEELLDAAAYEAFCNEEA